MSFFCTVPALPRGAEVHLRTTSAAESSPVGARPHVVSGLPVRKLKVLGAEGQNVPAVRGEGQRWTPIFMPLTCILGAAGVMSQAAAERPHILSP